VAAYFGAANGASTALYTYTARGAEISSTGGAKLQRERRAKTAHPPGAPKYSALRQHKQQTHRNIHSTRSKYPNKSSIK
jgi:hypothetical protein